MELWNAFLEGGRDLGVMPHGLEVLKLLRLEKGHITVSQDMDFDTSPAKVLHVGGDPEGAPAARGYSTKASVAAIADHLE